MTVFSIFLIFCVLTLVLYIRINRAKILGIWGEKKVSSILSLLGKEYHVFNDVLIKTSYGTSQIDHLVVSPYGVFVIETKNYKGWIFGSANSDKWTQNIWGHKYQLANPIRQNNGHIKSLQSVLPQFCSNQYVSIIVFSHKAKLKVKLDDNYNIIHTWSLIHRIHNYQDEVLTSDQQKEYMSSLQRFLDSTKEEKKSHISSVKQKNSRHDSLIRSGICPQCGGSLIKRKGKYGSFYGCSNYPKCKFTSN